jgi:hypothetical protein
MGILGGDQDQDQKNGREGREGRAKDAKKREKNRANTKRMVGVWKATPGSVVVPPRSTPPNSWSYSAVFALLRVLRAPLRVLRVHSFDLSSAS